MLRNEFLATSAKTPWLISSGNLADNLAQLYIPVMFEPIATEIIAMAAGNTVYVFCISTAFDRSKNGLREKELPEKLCDKSHESCGKCDAVGWHQLVTGQDRRAQARPGQASTAQETIMFELHMRNSR